MDHFQCPEFIYLLFCVQWFSTRQVELLMGFWRFIRDLELLEYLGWPHEHPAVLTKELRVLLSWHRGASLIEKAVIRNKIVERSHWHSLPRAEIMNGLLTWTPLARKCQDA